MRETQCSADIFEDTITGVKQPTVLAPDNQRPWVFSAKPVQQAIVVGHHQSAETELIRNEIRDLVGQRLPGSDRFWYAGPLRQPPLLRHRYCRRAGENQYQQWQINRETEQACFGDIEA
ncbi:MAG: hypothetical protein ACE5FQ_16490, partial [Thiogranum sp.]